MFDYIQVDESIEEQNAVFVSGVLREVYFVVVQICETGPGAPLDPVDDSAFDILAVGLQNIVDYFVPASEHAWEVC